MDRPQVTSEQERVNDHQRGTKTEYKADFCAHQIGNI